MFTASAIFLHNYNALYAKLRLTLNYAQPHMPRKVVPEERVMFDHMRKCAPLKKVVPFILGASIMATALIWQQAQALSEEHYVMAAKADAARPSR